MIKYYKNYRFKNTLRSKEPMRTMLHICKCNLAFIVMLLWLCFSGCKKENSNPQGNQPDVTPTTGTRTQLSLDSLYIYARQIYLWNDALPPYETFDPRVRYASVTPEYAALCMELFDISQLKINPATGIPFELLQGKTNPKYSYIEQGITTPGRNAGVPPASGSSTIMASVLQSGNKKVGYIAVGLFPKLSDCQALFDEAFSVLSTENPTVLVIDLRTNTGGYVESSEYLANLIAPSVLEGKVIFSEQFNSLMQNGKASILRHQPYLDDAGKPVLYKGRNATMADADFTEAGNTYTFSKKGKLESVKDIYFIVSGLTASASELLISCLKPWLNVKLVGEKTYGKPVGFFGINIDQYSVYLSSFLIRNAEGWFDYFDGMQPDVAIKMPGDPVLGDSDEPVLNKVLELISGSPGSGARVLHGKTFAQFSKRGTIADKEAQLPMPMIENRLKLKQ